MRNNKVEQPELFEDIKTQIAKEHGKLGGLARAQSLSPEERSEIAARGAAARWGESIPTASYVGTLKIGDLEIPCAVLPDKTRVLHERGVMAALGINRIGRQHEEQKKARDLGGPFLPRYLALPSLKPFISKELLLGPFDPIRYREATRGQLCFGVRAEALPMICDIWLKARSAGVLRTPSQFETAFNAEILVRALAQTGIVALVDEATGFQYERGKTELAEILQLFISNEAMRWVKTFSDDFYKEIYRLKGWDVSTFRDRPGVVGRWTIDLAYQRLAPGIVEELKQIVPLGSTGKPKHRYHQHLTENHGYRALLSHLGMVVGVMKLSRDGDWDGFYRNLNAIAPKFDETLELFPPEARLEEIPETFNKNS